MVPDLVVAASKAAFSHISNRSRRKTSVPVAKATDTDDGVHSIPTIRTHSILATGCRTPLHVGVVVYIGTIEELLVTVERSL